MRNENLTNRLLNMDFYKNITPQKVEAGLFLLLFPFLISACKAEAIDYRDSKFYVDKTLYSEGRRCFKVEFNCLSESKDKIWQTFDVNDKNLIENYELTKADLDAKKRVIKADEKMALKLSKEDMDAFERINQKQFIKEQAESLEKQFPGFWRDVPKPIRYRWIKRAITKANKYNYNGSVTDSIQIIELCARIGLDFDLNPKWGAITNFIAHADGPYLAYGNIATRYIDFTVFKKNTDRSGRPINDWSLRTALQFLPYPKRKIPKLNDE